MAEYNATDVPANQTAEEDYYSLLNLDKNATEQEITNAYRRLSRLYHPDKHSDPEKKQQAELLFNKTKCAHEVLSDPHKRAIYDTVGFKGIQTEGWLIIERTRTPQEIREEYEQLVKEREERRLQQQTNPKGTLIVGINAVDVFDSYDEDSSYPNVEISSMSLSQSVEAPIDTSNVVTLNGNLSSQNGTGAGSVGCTVRKILSSKSSLECGISGGNGLVFTMKGFRHLTSKSFGSLQSAFHFTPLGIVLGFQSVIGKQLTKHTAGYITWNAGNNSSIKTSVAWTSPLLHQLTTDLQFGIRGNFISINYRHKFDDETKLKTSIKFSSVGIFFEYGCEKKVFQNSMVGATMSVGLPAGVTLKLKVVRANQTYLFPILLSEDLLPSAIFYGTIAPILGWYLIKVVVIKPYQEREKKKLREENSAKLAERKKEALIAVNLMQETYERIREQEECKRGLIIIKAFYGRPEDLSNLPEMSTDNQNVIDVKIQLQCLVKDSRLILPARPKSNLPGFYDPCAGEEKYLFVNYSYHNRQHSITVKDEEVLKIPADR